MKKKNKLLFLSIVSILIVTLISVHSLNNSSNVEDMETTEIVTKKGPPFTGVNMIGYFTAMKPGNHYISGFPENYYEESFKKISQAGMNHVRYVLYWDAYVNDPFSFLNELVTVAETADRWGINILYDNHQYHTSAWLNPVYGHGFPSFLFSNDPSYPYSGGGSPSSPVSKTWWSEWWNRSITDKDGNDGWSLQLDFLKTIVNAVDRYNSTLGYEILNEPQIHSLDQWEKIGEYNSFMATELRTITQKTIAYSMTIPFDTNSPVEITAQNIEKMIPANRSNVVFKSSLYGIPELEQYHNEKVNVIDEVIKKNNIPLYIGEWNKVERKAIVVDGDSRYILDYDKSDINQTEVDLLIDRFKKTNVWGSAYWYWNFKNHDVVNFNLIDIKDGNLETTKYFEYLKNAITDYNYQ